MELMRIEDFKKIHQKTRFLDVFLIPLNKRNERMLGGYVVGVGEPNKFDTRLRKISLGFPKIASGDIYIFYLDENNKVGELNTEDMEDFLSMMEDSAKEMDRKHDPSIVLASQTGEILPMEPISDENIIDILRACLGHRTSFTPEWTPLESDKLIVSVGVEVSPQKHKINKFASKLAGQEVYGDAIITKTLDGETHRMFSYSELKVLTQSIKEYCNG